MRESTAVRDAMLRFYDRSSAGDVASFDEVVAHDAALIIGTAPGEWVTERDRMRFGFEAEGLRLETGGSAVAYEEGSMGWVANEPAFTFPDGSAMKTRAHCCSARRRRQWALVHMHVSVGAPDEEVRLAAALGHRGPLTVTRETGEHAARRTGSLTCGQRHRAARVRQERSAR